MGELITTDKFSIKHQFGSKENIPIYIQFVPGTVLDVVINEASAAYQEPRDINCIVAKKHYGDPSQLKMMSRKKYFPLLRGYTDTPVKGDPVLLCDFGGINYYLGPLNSLNSPNFNIDTLNTGFVPKNNDTKMNSKSTTRDKYNIPKNYFIAPVQRLQKAYNELLDDPTKVKEGEDGSIAKKDTHGDMTFEGRYGNSIRIGSRGAYPLVTISNGRNIGQSIEKSYDGSLIGITSAGSLLNHFGNFVLASDTIEENSRLISGGNDSEETEKFNYDFGLDGEEVQIGNQIFMNSDKITINARKNNITLSSLVNTDIGAGNNLTINTKNYTSIESSNIYLGKQAQEQKEPLVLGEQLKLFLEEIITLIESLKVTGCIAGLSGPIDPGTITKINQLKQKLSSPEFYSEYHFIEDNGQKAD
jgi:hypothetical protein